MCPISNMYKQNFPTQPHHDSCQSSTRKAWSRAQVKTYYQEVYNSVTCSADLADWMEKTLEGISDPSARNQMRQALLIENQIIKNKCQNADPNTDRRKEHLNHRVNLLEYALSHKKRIIKNREAQLEKESSKSTYDTNAQLKSIDHYTSAALIPVSYPFYECEARGVADTSPTSAVLPKETAASCFGLFSAIGAASQLPCVAAVIATVPILYFGYKAWSYCTKNEKSD